MTLVLANKDFGSVARILNLPTPVGDAEPATKGYVDSLVQGLNFKANCRVGSISNISIATPGASIDGIAMAINDRVLLKDQGTLPDNGIYLWNGAAVPMTRSLDANTGAELVNAITTVSEGTNTDTTWRQDVINITIGVTSITWVAFGIAAPLASETTAGIAEIANQAEVDAGTDDTRIVTPLKLANGANRKLKYSASFGDGVATSYGITHNLGSLDVILQVYANSGGATVECDMVRTNANTVTLTFSAAPTANQYRIVVLG